MRSLGRYTSVLIAFGVAAVLTACGGGGGGTQNPPPPGTVTLTVHSTNPATGVTIGYTVGGSNVMKQGTTPFTVSTNAGTAIMLSAPSIATGSNNTFSSWTGCSSVASGTCSITVASDTTVTANYATPSLTTPTVTVTPAFFSISTAQTLSVTVTVAGTPTPTGSVTLTSGAYSSGATTLTSGSATINISAGSLAVGSDTLRAAYTPDSNSSSLYNAATGTSSAVTVTQATTVSVNQTSTGPAITDQLLGMNMASWYDIVSNKTAIQTGFQTAGIKAVRWPGGSWSDIYHWSTNSNCFSSSDGSPNSNDTFTNFLNDVVLPNNLDLALTADYGTNSACTGPGDPAEAAAWVTASLNGGVAVSHMTVGNEEYGSWEEDLHTTKNDAATYASATKNGYYPDIKAASPDTLVGVDVNPGNSPSWDPIVLANAKGSYDFVEYHFYPQAPGQESDTYLVQQAAQALTTSINTIKTELATAGVPNTPIYVGEIGSVYTDPGKQSSSITQALFAGQVLGEMMNDGVARATWWIGFGGCGDSSTGNFSNSLYGWQNFGGYMVFSDGLPEYGCASTSSVAAGTLLPTARAYQLFSNIAVTGENVLTASVSGDTADVRAYAATHSGGTALVLFNLNQTTNEPISLTLSGQNASTDVTVLTYSKAIYDQSKSNVWAAPTTTDLGAQSLPLNLSLAPWSMNVILIR